jgi:hypothetical protein
VPPKGARKVLDKIEGAMDTAVNGVFEAGGRALSAVKKGTERVLDGVANGVANGIDRIGNFFRNA